MRIDTHRGLFVAPAGPEDVGPAVATLTDPGRAFIIVEQYPRFPEAHALDYLDNDDDFYVQAAGSVEEGGFLVEYRDGRPGDHYRADRRVTADELTALLERYVRQEDDWRSMLTWHRVRVDVPGATA